MNFERTALTSLYWGFFCHRCVEQCDHLHSAPNNNNQRVFCSKFFFPFAIHCSRKLHTLSFSYLGICCSMAEISCFSHLTHINWEAPISMQPPSKYALSSFVRIVYGYGEICLNFSSLNTKAFCNKHIKAAYNMQDLLSFSTVFSRLPFCCSHRCICVCVCYPKSTLLPRSTN